MTPCCGQSGVYDARNRAIQRGAGPSRMTVAVAMSGGVDSSTAAALLQRDGHHVVGLTMQIWSDDANSSTHCSPLPMPSAVRDAKRVAECLGIPHHVVNLESEFRELVVKEFCEQYSRGRTPNPCIVCNSLVKFGLLLRRASELGADRLATGHYARLGYDAETKRHLLLRGVDPQKDQAYALYRLTQGQLSHLLFPLGHYTKRKVRSLAREFGLPVASRGESQEICFIPDNDYRGFLRRNRKRPGQEGQSHGQGSVATRGAIVNTSGQVLGSHTGIEDYTIGQRKGLGIASDRRHYVVAIDAERNLVVVGEEHELYSSELEARSCNWVSIERPWDEMRAEAKIRYSFEPVGSTVRVESGSPEAIRVVFDEPVRAVTPGQAVVLYDGDVLLGGGIVENSSQNRTSRERREGDTGMVSNP